MPFLIWFMSVDMNSKMVFNHVIRRPCTKQWQIWLMFCIIIFRTKFLTDVFLFNSVYQHGGEDVRWKAPIVIVTNHFEIFITWSVFLVMFYSGCNWFSLSCLFRTFGISFLFFFSCQFESFLLELQEGRKIETFLFCLFLVFGSWSTGAILALKHNRVPTNLRQNFMRNEALLVTGGWEVAAVNTLCADSAP